LSDYDAIAYQAIIALLQAEHAAIWLEIEAKLADRPYHDPASGRLLKGGLNPHHLTNARKNLLEDEMIEEITQHTRGGTSINIMALSNRGRQKTAFEKAAARKRLLQARYLSWTKASGGNVRFDALPL
jgi:hypothetical protein